MQPRQLASMFAAALAVATLTSQAQDRPLTRAEVKAELSRAQASGEHERLLSDYGPTNMIQGQRTAPRRDSRGALGRTYGKPAATTTTSEKAVPIPMGDEGE